MIREELHLSAFMAPYTEVKGYPPCHPAMMVALLLYANCNGVYSSRRIARGCEERLDFQAVTALNQPNSGPSVNSALSVSFEPRCISDQAAFAPVSLKFHGSKRLDALLPCPVAMRFMIAAM